MARKVDFSKSAGVIDAAFNAVKKRPALFQDDGSEYLVIDVDQIDPNPDQPRTSFDEESIAGLAASIRQDGLIQPIRVQPMIGGRYQLVAGERRLRAVKHLGDTTIAALVKKTPKSAILALVENIHRDDLNALETARGLQKIMAEEGLDQAGVAERVGKSKSYVSRALRFLELPDAILSEYSEHQDKVSWGVLAEIVSVDDPDAQVELWKAAKGGAAVKELRSLKKGEAPALPTTPHAMSEDGEAEEPKKQVASGPKPAPALLADGALRLAGRITKARADRLTLNAEQREALNRLRAEIDALLNG